MAARLLALRAGRPLPPGRFLVLISVRGWVDSRAIVRMEGLGQLKNSMTSSGIEIETFHLVPRCLSQLRYRMPHSCNCGYQFSEEHSASALFREDVGRAFLSKLTIYNRPHVSLSWRQQSKSSPLWKHQITFRIITLFFKFSVRRPR
jgi:hypothetical protein